MERQHSSIVETPGSPEEIQTQLQIMDRFLATGRTRNLNFRVAMLERLSRSIRRHEEEILEALHKDLGKSTAEGYTTEVGILYENIRHFQKNLHFYARRKPLRRHKTNFLSQGYLYKEPYGKVLVISSFNYPFQLALEPLIGALAAGNTVVLKPSDQAGYTEAVLQKVLAEAFPPSYVRVLTGGPEVVEALTQAPFDYIFFTGSTRTGKRIMENAARNLIPVTLELGGKSPAIVGLRANLKNAARKIAYGKFINAGQTCIAPDYVFVHEKVQEEFQEELKKTLKRFYGEDPRLSPDYSRIINRRAFQRLEKILEADGAHLIYGGATEVKENYISPTLLTGNFHELTSMEEEIFGPILPIIPYREIQEVLRLIQSREKPLALYVFTEDRPLADAIIRRLSFGGGCINDTLFHITSPYMHFGGVGSSGMGRYHGKASFDTFTHEKSVLKSSSALNMRLNEPPIGKLKEKIIRKVLR